MDGGFLTAQRLHHAGWVGIGYDVAPPYDMVSWWRFIEYGNQYNRIYPLQAYADSYFWDLAPGVTIDLEVDW